MKAYTRILLFIAALFILPTTMSADSEYTVKMGEVVKLEIPASVRSSLSFSTGKTGKWDVNQLELEVVSYSWDYAYVKGLKETSLSVVQLTITHNHNGIFGDKYYYPFHVKVTGSSSGGGNTGGSGNNDTTPILQSVNIPSIIYLEVYQSQQLTPELVPSNAKPKLTWTSSDTSVASVYDGYVTAFKVGTTMIKVISDNGKYAYCYVYVSKAQPTSVYIPSSKELEIGDQTTISPTLYPSYSETTYTWSSSNRAVATVVGGVVKAVGAGVATITVQTANNKSATCSVKVKNRDTITSIDDVSEQNDEYISIYTLNGQLVYQGLKSEYTVPQPGIYIIKEPAGTKKVYIK